MKASSATSAKAGKAILPRSNSSTARSSDRRPSSRTSADQSFSLSGPSDPPDPTYYAYRKDLADIALAGHVIASHFAEPLERRLRTDAPLRAAPGEDSETIRELAAGEPFALLDNTLGWAWGYAGPERRVGYVQADALGA